MKSDTENMAASSFSENDLIKSQIDKNVAEKIKLELEAIEIRKRLGNIHFFILKIFPPLIAALLITSWVLAFLRPLLIEQGKIQEYKVQNMQNEYEKDKSKFEMDKASFEIEKQALSSELEKSKKMLNTVVDSFESYSKYKDSNEMILKLILEREKINKIGLIALNKLSSVDFINELTSTNLIEGGEDDFYNIYKVETKNKMVIITLKGSNKSYTYSLSNLPFASLVIANNTKHILVFEKDTTGEINIRIYDPKKMP
jgi:hypothetical protein